MNPDDFHPDDLIGATRSCGIWRLLAGRVAEWILDYESYDPGGVEKSNNLGSFRSGLLRISEENVNEFHRAMAQYQLSEAALKEFLRRVGPSQWPLTFVVDFDARIYVSSFWEVPVCDYLPNGWESIEHDPLSYVPAEIKLIWQPTAPFP